MQTKTELTLEQIQQGVSDEVLLSIKGVEELKRNVKIKGEKKEAFLTLRQKPEMEKKDAPNKYDGLGDSLLERMQRSREIRDASLKRSHPTSPDGVHSHHEFWGSSQPQQHIKIKKVVKITKLRNDERVEGAVVALPFEAVEEVSARSNNTLYGYFIGKRLAFKLFENKDGMDKVLENSPWLIRMVPLILNIWFPNTDLKKAEVKKAPVWVKLHHVPIVAYSEIGLSLITTQIGRPIMLDSYTSNMCLSFWSRSTYARALIEVSADKEILESLTITILVGKDKGHMLATIDIEYEWKPPRCSHCLIFDHITDKCPKMPKETIPNITDDEGFVEVKKKKNKNKNKPQRPIDGIRLTKPPPKMYYRHVEAVTVSNSFDALNMAEKEDVVPSDFGDKWEDVLNASDSEVDEEIMVEQCRGIATSDFTTKGATTPITERNLSMHKLYIRNRPWCLLGDFNAALFLEDSTASGANIDISMREFRDCVEDIEVMDVHRTGLQFTWNQKPKGANGILKKIDRIMANTGFHDQFVGAHAIFKPYRISDHSPSVLCLPTLCKEKPKPFKFFNVLTKHERFKEVVNEGWVNQISGFHMFNVVKKLKNLKKPIRKLLYEKGNLHANVSSLRSKLDSIQSLLDADPFNANLREAEASCVVEFNQAALMEERFLKQKAKINWLKEGDSNSAYFHKTVKSRVSRSRIDTITNAEGLVFVNEAVPNIFVSHYEMFLGLAGETQGFNDSNLFKTCLNEQVATNMVRNVTPQEVKEALFSMGDDKSPGPDGYTACFFKAAWEVVADDVTNAICEFFRNGNLLKELLKPTLISP
ncbi:zinc knuckle CX2CX4HX4C containing protein [Tanacetum coccineum]